MHGLPRPQLREAETYQRASRLARASGFRSKYQKLSTIKIYTGCCVTIHPGGPRTTRHFDSFFLETSSMKFSTFLFAFGTILGAVSADSNTQDRVSSVDTISNSEVATRNSPRTATWRLYNRTYRPPQVRTVSLGKLQKQTEENDSTTISNPQLSSRSSARSGSWRVFKRKPRPIVAKVISLEEARQQAEGGSAKVGSSSSVESRSVDASTLNEEAGEKSQLEGENLGIVGDPVGIPHGRSDSSAKSSGRRRSAGQGGFMARRRERV